jgi:hypothetical protein
MQDPIGFFLTWVTYGTWLPGDARGWVEFRHGWKLPDPIMEFEAAAMMKENACRLTGEQRIAVSAIHPAAGIADAIASQLDNGRRVFFSVRMAGLGWIPCQALLTRRVKIGALASA